MDSIEELRRRYRAHGFAVACDFLSTDESTEVLHLAEGAGERMISVSVNTLIAKNRFLTINGDELEALIPSISTWASKLCAVASELEGRPLALLENRTVGLSLNLTPPGGILSWHYDRNLVTAVVHLNAVSGGEFEIYPRYRVRLRNNHFGPRRFVQRVFDAAMRPSPVRRLVGRKKSLPPRAGAALFMDSTCLHQVAPVTGTTHRGAIVFCFDEPGKVFDRHRTRNYYGYRDQPVEIYR